MLMLMLIPMEDSVNQGHENLILHGWEPWFSFAG